mgnify:CR=1 FL=1
MFLHFRCFWASLPWAVLFWWIFHPCAWPPFETYECLNFLVPNINKGGMFSTLVAFEPSSHGYVFGKCCTPSLSHPSNSTTVSHFCMFSVQTRRMFHSFVRFQAFVPRAAFFRDFTLNSTNVSHVRRYLSCQCIVELVRIIWSWLGKLELQHTTADPRPTSR